MLRDEQRGKMLKKFAKISGGFMGKVRDICIQLKYIF